MEKAILNLAVAAVSPIIGKFTGNLSASYFGGDVTSAEIQKLQNIILPKIQTVIQAAEAIPADKLKPWLMDMKAAVFEAEDVLDLYEYKAIKNKVKLEKYQAIRGYKRLQKLKGKSNEFFAFMLPKTKLKNSLKKLEQSANEADELLNLLPSIRVNRQTAPQNDANSQQSIPTVSHLSSPIFGRDGELDNLINMLINEAGGESTCNRTSIPVLAVLGIGGAGKTTFTQAVCHDSKVKSHFEMKMWVYVSRNFDVRRVTREIIEQGGSTCSNIINLDAMQKKLEDILNLKKFLLVLDDIWCEDKEEWDKLLIPLNKGGNKESRIIITTRTKIIASSLGVENENLVTLKELEDGDILSILKHYAFGDARKIIKDRALADVGKKIANKLKNSPLAARLIGSFLRRVGENVDEWEMVLKQDMPSEPLERLLLSFQRLRSPLQRCFAFCSLFPKGHIFDTNLIDDLVRIWIAEGFVEVPKGSELTTVEKGRQYFNELVSNSFFQSHPNYPSEYVIHDLLHDVAEKVSEDHCFRIETVDPEDIPPTTVPPTTVHLSIVGSHIDTFPVVSVLANLRTLMCIDSRIDSSLLDVCTKLRVLYCVQGFYGSPSIIPELPRSIGQLKHLRYLTAECMEQFPDSFSRLYHLQFLHLPYHMIKRVPKIFSNLVNLQCLLPESLARIKIPEIGKLTSLQTLESYRVETSREFGIGQLKNLNQLRESLEIEGLENVKDKIEATEARLNRKKHLEELSLGWNHSTSGDGRVDNEEVLEGMEPHSNLKKLEISEYRGAKAPSWMPRILPGLQSLRLIDCPNLTGVPRLPHSLERLAINNSSGFEDLFSSFISFNHEEEEEEKQRRLHQQNCGLSQPFALEELIIVECYVLREETFDLSLQKFDLLHVLKLQGLPKLTSLLLGSNLKHLCDIKIIECRNLQYLEGIGALPHLESLEIRDLPELTRMGKLQALESLKIFRCPKLTAGVGAGRVRAIADRLPYLEWSSVEIDEVSKCPKLTAGVGVGGERATADRLPSIHRLGIVVIDDPMLLAVLLKKQGLNSIGHLTINECLQDRSFSSTEEEDLFLQLTSIKELYFEDCEKLPSFSANLQKLSSLQALTIRDCREMESLPNLPTSLNELVISGCPKLQSLEGIGALPHLEHLEIEDLSELTAMGNLQALTSIRYLKVSKCPKLTAGLGVGRERAIADRLPSINIWMVEIDDPLLLAVLLEKQGLNSIGDLTIRECSQDRIFSSPEEEDLFLQLTSIKELCFNNCKKLLSLPANLKMLSSLKTLSIWNCTEMESLPNLPTSLTQLEIQRCPKLESLPNLPTSLTQLEIRRCPKLESPPNLPTSLDFLTILHCPKLKDKYGEGGPLHHKIRHIPDIDIF